jgi:hypothetical protein
MVDAAFDVEPALFGDKQHAAADGTIGPAQILGRKNAWR